MSQSDSLWQRVRKSLFGNPTDQPPSAPPPPWTRKPAADPGAGSMAGVAPGTTFTATPRTTGSVIPLRPESQAPERAAGAEIARASAPLLDNASTPPPLPPRWKTAPERSALHSADGLSQSVAKTTDRPSAAPLSDAPRSSRQENLGKVLHVMDKMENYFDNNEQRAAYMARSVERFAESLEKLTDMQQIHGDSIKSIAETAARNGELAERLTSSIASLAESTEKQGEITAQISGSISNLAASAERTGELTVKMSESVGQMPASLDQLGSSLRSIMERLVDSQESMMSHFEGNQSLLVEQAQAIKESQAAFSAALDRFGGAIDELAATNRANAETFKRVGVSEMEQRHALTKLVSKLARRVTILLGVLGALTIGALAMIIILMMMGLDRPLR